MNAELNALTFGMSWGDVPTWIAALGTSGTLITGMYIILRDRLNNYRSQFDNLTISVRLNPPTGTAEKDLYLMMTNNSWSVFSDVEILSMAHLQLSSGKQILIGFKSVRGSIMPRMITTTVPILRSVYALHTPPRPVLTYRATDHAGRTWFKERGKQARLITWRNRFFLQRKLDRLESNIRRAVGDHFIEPQPVTDTVTDI